MSAAEGGTLVARRPGARLHALHDAVDQPHGAVRDLAIDHGGRADALLTLAGLGGDTVAALVERLVARHPAWPLRFVLCPVRQCLVRRERLAAQPLDVEAETLGCERGRSDELWQWQAVATPRQRWRPWPEGVCRWPDSALSARYRNERVQAHRHRPDTAARYAALQSNRNRKSARCVG